MKKSWAFLVYCSCIGSILGDPPIRPLSLDVCLCLSGGGGKLYLKYHRHLVHTTLSSLAVLSQQNWCLNLALDNATWSLKKVIIQNIFCCLLNRFVKGVHFSQSIRQQRPKHWKGSWSAFLWSLWCFAFGGPYDFSCWLHMDRIMKIIILMIGFLFYK